MTPEELAKQTPDQLEDMVIDSLGEAYWRLPPAFRELVRRAEEPHPADPATILACAYRMMGPWQHRSERNPRAPYAAETWKRFQLAVPADWSGMAYGAVAIVHRMTDGSVKYLVQGADWTLAESVEQAQAMVDQALKEMGLTLVNNAEAKDPTR